MRISCVQMDMRLGEPEENFAHAAALLRQVAAVPEKPDVLVLPETWNTGFFPAQDLANLADDDGRRVKAELGALAGELGVNLVAGSVANRRGSRVYNTSYIFDRQGCCIASYDKTHLFTPMHEDAAFACGNRLCSFPLDGVSCGIITCYDIRFPELTRSLALRGLDVLFVVAQWPDVRIGHLNCLAQARAIENQMFVAVCNSCGAAGETQYGGNSAIIDPWGQVLCRAGGREETVSAACDLAILQDIRNRINVFRDRKPELYQV